MNVYTCWHEGTLGYGCKLGKNRWMFVPELGQNDNRIYKNISLSELVFNNKYDYRHELKTEENVVRISLFAYLLSLVFSMERATTIGGLLFLSQYR